MREEYVIDPALIAWKKGETEGLSFSYQVLLDGANGGPEAIRFRFDPCPSVYAHMHLTSQFQLLLSGCMQMPRRSLNLLPVSIHYTDHNTPYGPFSVSPGHDMLVLHPKRGGLISMAHIAARRQINLAGRLLVGAINENRWTTGADSHDVEVQMVMPRAEGPGADAFSLSPGSLTPVEQSAFGRYEVVLKGSVTCSGRELRTPGLRFVRGVEVAEPMVARSDGAVIVVLTFDADAEEGGLNGEGLAVAAEEAMAMAI